MFIGEKMPIVYLSFGSNVGNRKKYIEEALEFLRKNASIKIKSVSSLYETEPVGYENQDWFINGALELETEISPDELLKLVKTVEEKIGRQKTFRWGPREIDLDILLYGQKCIDTPELVIPHPRMHKRKFVLIPLAEIAPDVIHPVFQKTIGQLLKDISKGRGVGHVVQDFAKWLNIYRNHK